MASTSVGETAVNWAVIYPLPAKVTGAGEFAWICPDVPGWTRDEPPDVTTMAISTVACVFEQSGRGLIIAAQPDSPLDGIEPGPYRSLRDINAAVADFTGESCRTLATNAAVAATMKTATGKKA